MVPIATGSVAAGLDFVFLNMVLKPPLPKFLWRPAAGAYFERIPNAPTVQFEAQTMPNSEGSVICGRFEGFGDHFKRFWAFRGCIFQISA